MPCKARQQDKQYKIHEAKATQLSYGSLFSGIGGFDAGLSFSAESARLNTARPSAGRSRSRFSDRSWSPVAPGFPGNSGSCRTATWNQRCASQAGTPKTVLSSRSSASRSFLPPSVIYTLRERTFFRTVVVRAIHSFRGTSSRVIG